MITIKEWLQQTKGIQDINLIDAGGFVIANHITLFDMPKYLDCPIKEVRYSINKNATLSWIDAYITIDEVRTHARDQYEELGL